MTKKPGSYTGKIPQSGTMNIKSDIQKTTLKKGNVISGDDLRNGKNGGKSK
ncbi:MAG: hypothetical protein LBT88_06620 [Oscillospiraceae bacterium]|jgi:hypothetical protein|nr:hypothetical protein [Oscillospiraceae bacterium]